MSKLLRLGQQISETARNAIREYQVEYSGEFGGYENDENYARGAKRGRREPTEAQAIKKEIDAMKQQLASLNHHIEKQEAEQKDYEDRIQEATTRVAEVTSEITIVEQDLGATRTHASDEGMMGERELVDGFLKLAGGISTLTNNLSNWYRERTHKYLSDGRVRIIKEGFRGEAGKEDADMFIDLAVHVDMPSKWIIYALLRYYLCSSLVQLVFEPFLPGRDDKETVILNNIYRTILEAETQDRSGRWRALTYREALNQRDSTWCENHATMFVQRFDHLLQVIGDVSLTPDHFAEAVSLTMGIFNDAANFKDTAMLKYIDTEFRIVLPRYGEVSPSSMEEVCGGRYHSGKVILGVGLMLETSRLIQDGPKYAPYVTYPIPAWFIGDGSELFV